MDALIRPPSYTILGDGVHCTLSEKKKKKKRSIGTEGPNRHPYDSIFLVFSSNYMWCDACRFWQRETKEYVT
jgi:hypothetical protein